MLANILKVIGGVGVIGGTIGGGVAYVASSSKNSSKKVPRWEGKLDNIGPILSCKNGDGTDYELLLSLGGGILIKKLM